MRIPLILNALVVAGASLAAAADAAPVGAALARPAVPARVAGHAVVLGAAQAGTRLVAVGERGSVLLSDDNGASWHQAAVPVSVTLTAVRFVDAQRGFAVGHGGVVLATTDGGLSWVKRLDGVRAAQIALKAAKEASKESGDTRALKEAERLVADGPDKPLLDLHFFDAMHGIVVGAYNLAFATDDGGQSWRSLMALVDNPKSLHLYAVRAQGDVLLLAGEQGLALRSDDRGRSFRKLEVPYKGSFFTAELMSADARQMVLAGLRGNVWRSADAGATWSQWALPSAASITGSALLPAADGEPRALVLVDQSGRVMTASGDTITARPGTPLPPLNGVLPLKDGGLLALTVAGPMRAEGITR